MPEFLSEDELQRISAFANRPKFEREPEQLLPDGADSEPADESDERDRRADDA